MAHPVGRETSLLPVPAPGEVLLSALQALRPGVPVLALEGPGGGALPVLVYTANRALRAPAREGAQLHSTALKAPLHKHSHLFLPLYTTNSFRIYVSAHKIIRQRFSVRSCLISITIACSRLRRSPEGGGGVEQARSACSTPPPPSFARRSRANTRRERVKALRIRLALKGL